MKKFLLIFVLFSFFSFAQEDGFCLNPALIQDGRPNIGEEGTPICTTTHFRVHYSTVGVHATSLAYANQIAAFAESSYGKQVTEMGWRNPLPDGGIGGDNLYDIYIADFAELIPGTGTCFYGVTKPEPINLNEENAPSFIIITKYLGINSQLLKITVAHEFNHALQFAYSVKDKVDSIEQFGFWFHENTAVVIADLTWDLKFYLEFFSGSSCLKADVHPLNHPEIGLYAISNNLYNYAGSLWAKFLTEWKDQNILRKIWEKFGVMPGNFLMRDLDAALIENYDTNLDEALKEYAVWRYFTGGRKLAGKYFVDVALLPMLDYHYCDNAGTLLFENIQTPGGMQYFTIINLQLLSGKWWVG